MDDNSTKTGTTNADKPAYPTNARMHSDAQGMTKREIFAMAAMQGLLSKEGWAERIIGESPVDSALSVQLAVASVRMADELLKQLEHGRYRCISRCHDLKHHCPLCPKDSKDIPLPNSPLAAKMVIVFFIVCLIALLVSI